MTLTIRNAYSYIIPVFLALAAIGLSSSVFFQIQYDESVDLFHVFDISFYHFVPLLLWVIYLPFLFQLFQKHPLNKEEWKKNIKIHLIISLAFAPTARLIAITLDFWFKSQIGMIDVAVLPLVYEVRWTILASFTKEIFSYWVALSIMIYLQSKGQKPSSEKLILKLNSGTKIIPLEHVLWIKAAGNYVIVHTAKEEIKTRRTLSTILDHLNNDFIQIHRSLVVNQEAVSELRHWRNGEYLITLKDGTHLSSSRSFLENVRLISA